MTATGDSGRPLNILLVSARFAPFVGGTEIHAGEVAIELTQRGHNVTVLTTTWDETRSIEQHGDVQVIRVRALPHGSDLHYAPGIRAEIETGNWDLVHVHGYHTLVGPMALAAAQRAGLPTVLTFHSGGHSSTIRKLLRPVQVLCMRKLMLRAEALIAVSRFEASLFASRLGIGLDRISVIPNGVSRSINVAAPSPTAGDEGDAPATTDDTSKTILSVGRLVRYKGHHRIIRAMPEILRSHPDVRLLIIGRGPYEAKLRRLADKVGVADRVDFDFVPSSERKRLDKMMSSAALLLVLSNYESHGMVAHEALEAGVPVVVVNKTALSELVAAGQAQAVPPGASNRELAEIVTRTLNTGTGSTTVPYTPGPGWETITDLVLSEYRKVLPNSDQSDQRLPGIAS